MMFIIFLKLNSIIVKNPESYELVTCDDNNLQDNSFIQWRIQGGDMGVRSPPLIGFGVNNLPYCV